jgi:hypothetical protein
MPTNSVSCIVKPFARHSETQRRVTLRKEASLSIKMALKLSLHCRNYLDFISSNNELQLEYLDVTVLRRGVGEVRVVVGRAPAC